MQKNFLKNRKNKQLFNSTVEFNDVFQNYRMDIDELAKSPRCKVNPSQPDYTSTYIDIGGDLDNTSWTAPSNTYKFTSDCINRMKALEEAFVSATRGMRIIAEILPAGPNVTVEEKLTKVLGNTVKYIFHNS